MVSVLCKPMLHESKHLREIWNLTRWCSGSVHGSLLRRSLLGVFWGSPGDRTWADCIQGQHFNSWNLSLLNSKHLGSRKCCSEEFESFFSSRVNPNLYGKLFSAVGAFHETGEHFLDKGSSLPCSAGLSQVMSGVEDITLGSLTKALKTAWDHSMA